MALLVGMALNPLVSRYQRLDAGVSYAGKMILRIGIILMGVNLNFAQVVNVGKYLCFNALYYGNRLWYGNLIGRLFKMNGRSLTY